MDRLRAVKIRAALIVWVLIFTCGQSLAANHIHADNSTYEDCLLCVQSHNSAVASDSGFIALSIPQGTHQVTPKFDAWIDLAPPSYYLTRAPPQA